MNYGFSLSFSTKKENFNKHKIKFYDIFVCTRSYGVMVSTQDSESCDPSSNLGGTYNFFQVKSEFSFMIRQHFTELNKAVIAQLGER